MGGKASVAVATSCMYEKEAFNHQLDYIRDANKVCQFYAKLLMVEGDLPVKLDQYENYSSATEDHFNSLRKDVKEDLGMSYYQFYQFLDKLKNEYESTNMTQIRRRQLLVDVFNKCYAVQQNLIEDLWKSCDSYGMPAESSVAASTAGSETAVESSSSGSA